jgi:hypothetical protein
MMVLKDVQGNITHRYVYTAIRHVVEPGSNTENILVTLANKAEPNGNWNYSRLDFNEEDLNNFMTFNSQGNLPLRESVAFKVYEIAKNKGLIPQEAVNE